MRCFKLGLISGLLCFFSGCSLMTSIGVKTVAPSLKDASITAQYEHDFDHFKESIISQLKLLEMLLEIEPSNKSLLESLVKGYSGLGFGYYETIYLKDYYQDKENSEYKIKANDAYSRALGYADQYFKLKGTSLDKLTKLMNNQKKFNDYMDDEFANSDLVTLFYTTQSLASLINLNRNKVVLMGKINLASNMLNWVCKKNPDIEQGLCALFQAGMMATRPKMLGGNPTKAAVVLKKYFKKRPDNALAKVFYLQYIVIPSDNKKEFNQISSSLSKFFIRYENQFIFPNKAPKSPMNLLNAIAKERLLIMNQLKKEIF